MATKPLSLRINLCTALSLMNTVWISACAPQQETGATPSATALPATPAGEIYRVATEPNYAPFVLRDEHGQIDGFDVAILNAIAAKQGFSLSYSSHPWDGLFDTLAKNQADIVAGGITITEERQTRMRFSSPYFESRQTALLGPQAPAVTQFADLAGLKLSLKAGTTSDQVAQNLGLTENTRYEGSTFLTIKQVLLGKADATIGDEGVMRHYQRVYADNHLRILTDASLPLEAYGFAVRSDNTALQQKLDQGLAQIKADGTYTRLYQHWFF